MHSQPRLAEDAGPPLIGGPPRMLHDVLAEVTARFADEPAVVSTYERDDSDSSCGSTGHSNGDSPPQRYLAWTFTQLDAKAERLTHSLHTHHGIRSGSRLAVFLPNCSDWVLLFWAAVKLGATFVPLDVRAVGRINEARHYLEVIKPAAIFVDNASVADILRKNNALDVDKIALKVIVHPGFEGVPGWISIDELSTRHTDITGARASPQPAYDQGYSCGRAINDGDSAANGSLSLHLDTGMESIIHIIFTSGTYSLPKACPWSNRNIWAAGLSGDALDPLDHTDFIVQQAPPSHIMGINGMIHAWRNGATVVFPSADFDVAATLQAAIQRKCTRIAALPNMLIALLKQPAFDAKSIRSLPAVSIGDTINLPNLIAAAKDSKLLGVSKVTVELGMSEAMPICGFNGALEGMRVERGAVGVGNALSGVKVRICRDGSRKILARGETGELHTSGGMVIGEYIYGDNKPFYDDDEGHWITTGDRAVMDNDGSISIHQPYEDIIVRGGENLSVARIESCLREAGMVCQVVGIPDEIAREVPLAVVQLAEQSQIPKGKIHNLIVDSLGPAYLPTAYVSIEELGLASFPMTTSDNVHRAELRKKTLEYLSAKAMSNIQERSDLVRNTEGNGVASTTSLLISVLAKLIGQPEDSIPREQPLLTVIDPMNILRFQISVEKVTGKRVSLGDLPKNISISGLAARLDELSEPVIPSVESETQQGPPTASDMVHTHGDETCSRRTQKVTEAVLAKHGMSWTDVENIFPVPDLSCRVFEEMRPMASSVRNTLKYNATSPVMLRQALDKTLRRWSMFRSLAMMFDNTALFVIVRPSQAMSRASVAILPEVEDLDQLCKLRFPKADDNNVQLYSGGPLARFAITSVKNENCTGLVMLAHHSIFDATSIQAFSRDVELNLSNVQTSEPYTDYKLFADTLYLHSVSVPAQNSVAYHLNRLRGSGPLRETCWPPQRCPGWFIGDDTGYKIPVDPQNSLLQERRPVDGDDDYGRVQEIKKTAELEDLAELRSKLKVSVPTLFKAACAILNSRLSGAEEVMFANVQGGRQWPFLGDGIAKLLPNPVTIAGNTLSLVMNRIHVHGNERVGVYLTRLKEEQRSLTKHAHAPTAAISAQLNPSDAAAFYAGRRQLLNYNPSLGFWASIEGKTKGQLIKVEGFTEVMLEWHCGVIGSNTAVLIAQWDGAQFGKAKVERWTEVFMNTLQWLARLDNWGKTLADVDWSPSS